MSAKIERAAVPAPDLNDVALFVHVVQAASFSAAAKERGVPVSTVSRRVARLEATLGSRLLERTTRRLRLTDVGRTYFAHAERAIDELRQGTHHVRELDVVPRGRVRITAPVGLGAMLTAALQGFLAEVPGVTLQIELADRRVDLLGEGFDIALRAGAVDTPDFVGRKILESTRWLFASKAYLARRGRPRRLADLKAHDLIATRATMTGAVWELFDRAGRRHRLAFEPRVLVNELLAARNAALCGMGITLLPSPEVDEAELERVLPSMTGQRTALWLLYPAHRSLTAAVRACIDHLLSTLPQLSAPLGHARRQGA